MLQQSASARQTEKTVIDDYNAKLTARATAFANANSGVSPKPYIGWFRVLIFLGDDNRLRYDPAYQHDTRQSRGLRIDGCNKQRKW